MKNNFKCKDCNEEFLVMTYITTYPPDGGNTYKKEDRSGLLVCEHCNSENIEKIETFNGFCTNVGGFSSSSPEKKREMLQKRAKEHSNRPSSVEERRYRDKEVTRKAIEVKRKDL